MTSDHDALDPMARELARICNPGEATSVALLLALVLATPDDPANTFEQAETIVRGRRSALRPNIDDDSIQAAITLAFTQHVWWLRGEDASTEELMDMLRSLGVPARFLPPE